MKRSALLLCFLPAALVGGLRLTAQEPLIWGFGPSANPAQRQLEKRLISLPLAEKTEAYHRFLTEEPHVAGTPGGRRVAEYIHAQFKRFGVDSQLVEYEVLLSYPKHVEAELIIPKKMRLANPEAGYEVDKDSFDERVDPPWHAYSASGQVEGQAVYVNYGRAEDYDRLEELGVDVRGKIALARYFHGYRGGKSLEAEQRGVRALIVYSDPAEDGYVQGDVYPDGPWGPESKVQRGANVYDFLVPGDPLTPGWASTPGARRLSVEESRILPKIPTLPLSYADAAHVLKALGGPSAPRGWQGGLPFAYHIGPGPAAVRLDLEISRERRTIVNVIGTIRGSEHPDQMVVLSNHHDAWVYGAVDPSSGTASLIEAARVFGGLLKEGWRPRRTLILGAWDAEEYTLTGSTEWGEDRADELRQNAVACLNVDASTSGSEFAAAAVPSLRRFIVEAAADVPDPAGGSVLDRWRAAEGEENIRSYAVKTESELPVEIGILGSGSDYTVFFNFLGVPSVDMLFDGPYGVYHSQYDSHRWMRRFGDPGFRYHRAMVALWTVMATRLANAEILPLDYTEYARELKNYADELAGLTGDRLSMRPLEAAIERFGEAARQLRSRLGVAMRKEVSAATAAAVNRALMMAERDFTNPDGLPGRPWFKHLIYAPLSSYAAQTLPGIREAVADGDWRRAAQQRDVVVGAVDRAGARLREALQVLER